MDSSPGLLILSMNRHPPRLLLPRPSEFAVRPAPSEGDSGHSLILGLVTQSYWSWCRLDGPGRGILRNEATYDLGKNRFLHS